VKHTITLIPGDGIGPEVTGAVVRILETAGLEVEWESYLAGVLALERHGATLPPELLDSIRRNKVALKGPVTTPVGVFAFPSASLTTTNRTPLSGSAASARP